MASNIENLEEFNRALREFALKLVPEEVSKLHKTITLEILKRVVMKTPVDTGRARGNWQVSIGTPLASIIGGFPDSPSGSDAGQGAAAASKALAAGVAAISVLPPFSTVYLSNNVGYIDVLELGGFDPPNPGPSKDKRPGRKGRILVRGGYSIQAPRGMVGDTLGEMRKVFP